MLHLDDLVGEWVDACGTEEPRPFRRCPDGALPDESLDGAVHAVDGHGRVTRKEKRDADHLDVLHVGQHHWEGADQDPVTILTRAGVAEETNVRHVPFLINTLEVVPHDRRDLVRATFSIDLAPDEAETATGLALVHRLVVD